MKAVAMRRTTIGFERTSVEEATHLKIRLPGPTGYLILPVITRGPRRETPNWTWNGSLEAPTLHPSVLSKVEYGNAVNENGESYGKSFICHSWVTDGKVQFLDDCSHDRANTVADLLDFE